nr:MAG TPA: hypothetical protein [Caudoviricetes sp.]
MKRSINLRWRFSDFHYFKSQGKRKEINTYLPVT